MPGRVSYNAMPRAVIYFIERPTDRWFRGDHRFREPVRRLLRGPDPIGGIKRVFVNLIKGLDRLGVDYVTNIPFDQIRPTDMVGVIGLGVDSLNGYRQTNPILAGVAVAAHPTECPKLFEDYPVSAYVVHCQWVKRMYESHYGPRVATWAVGIDTDEWAPTRDSSERLDFLIYDKVRWDHDRVHRALVDPILTELRRRGLTYEILTYGAYKPNDLLTVLNRAKAMLFLCEHETQGLAYQQALSCNVPLLAWDPGQWLDPWRYRYGEGYVPATSIPFFDERCGLSFTGLGDFHQKLDQFLTLLSSRIFTPRDYVLENLTLEGCAQKYLELLRTHCT